MQQEATDYVKLQVIAEEKDAIDRELDQKIERFLELQDLIDSFE